MDTIFMNSKNSQITDPHRILLNLSDNMYLKKSDKYITFSNLSICHAWKNIKNIMQNYMFKTSAQKFMSII